MISQDDPEAGSQEFPHDHPQRMLILAYTRLFLLPERNDGSKLTTIASFGAFAVRLVELPVAPAKPGYSLWIELYDGHAGRVVDSAGLPDLLAAGPITEAFLAEAARRNELARLDPARGSR
jgi:hypothetical protein